MNSFPENSWCPAATTNATLNPAPVVLVVDDDPAIRRLLVRTLTAAGFEAIEAEQGRSALALLAKHPVDLLLTDLVMPDAEGIELIIEVRSTRPRLPILAISGGGMHGPGPFLTTARLIGANRTLAKPFDPADLLKIVRELLGSLPNS